jgi:hypothetical protein
MVNYGSLPCPKKPAKYPAARRKFIYFKLIGFHETDFSRIG